MSIQPVAKSKKASLYTKILLLAWPVMAQMFLQTLAQMVDMAMVGRLGQAAIAAVGLSFRPMFVGQAIFLGLGVATTALVARFIGAEDEDTATKAAAQALLTTSVLALVLAVCGFFFAREITLFMGAKDDVIQLGIQYLQAFSPGLFFLMLSTIMTSSLRAAGDTKTPFYASLFANALNVVLNYALIFGHFGLPALGVQGAALATSIAHLSTASILFIALLRGKGGLHLRGRDFATLDWPLIVRLFRVGIPAALERLVMSLSVMLHVKIVATLGTTAVAVSTLAGNIEQLSYMPSIGFSVAASTLVGQNLGAGFPQEAERSGWGATRLCVFFMGTMGVLFLLLPSLFVRIYTDDPAVIASAGQVLRLIGISQVPQAFAFVASGVLRGAGDTNAVLNYVFLGNVVIRLG
ncbi:MAG: MATE family efflux transporter, partial [Firmicutes bacterium]|nr:MATE family efflux transporter [Bacillota bacterium]